MHFLEQIEIEAWCARHGITLDAAGHLESDPSLTHHAHNIYANGQRSSMAPLIAARCVGALGVWDECLLWVTGWGIWGSSEDWPKYYAARGVREERRSLPKAPGHLFESTDDSTLIEFLTLVLENAWDAFLLPALGGSVKRLRIQVSHDEWIEVRSIEPISLIFAA